MSNLPDSTPPPVDMSSAAIEERLRTVAELFRLTTALGNARYIGPVEERHSDDDESSQIDASR